MPAKTSADNGGSKTRSKGGGDVAKSGKKKAQSRSDKAGLTMSVSKVHNHMLKHKKHPNSKGVTRVSVGGPVWVTAAIEYFAAELIEQAGNKAVDPKQKGGARKRITAADVLNALRGDKELNKAMAGFRVLLGDKISGKEISDELLTKEEKYKRETAKETSRAQREAAAH